MKSKYLLILISLIFIGCSSKYNHIESIELMAYDWLSYNEKEEVVAEYIKCRLYSSISNTGKANVYRTEKMPIKKNVYYSLQLNSDFFNDLISSLDTINKISSFNENDIQGRFYCGEYLRVRIKYKDNEPKTFFFILEKDSPYSEFINLYEYLNNGYKSEDYTSIKDTLELDKKREDFINFTMNEDTVNYPYLKMLQPSHDSVLSNIPIFFTN